MSHSKSRSGCRTTQPKTAQLGLAQVLITPLVTVKILETQDSEVQNTSQVEIRAPLQDQVSTCKLAKLNPYRDRELSETLMMRSQTYLKIQCPHCSRKFWRKAGERHIPLWDKIYNKPKPLFRNKENQFLPSLNKSRPVEGTPSLGKSFAKFDWPDSCIKLIDKDPRTHSVKPKSKM